MIPLLFSDIKRQPKHTAGDKVGHRRGAYLQHYHATPPRLVYPRSASEHIRTTENIYIGRYTRTRTRLQGSTCEIDSEHPRSLTHISPIALKTMITYSCALRIQEDRLMGVCRMRRMRAMRVLEPVVHNELRQLPAPDILSNRGKGHVEREDHVVAHDFVVFVRS